MKKIILSLSVIVAVAAVLVGATTAFYSDTEVSTGNTFTAGALDLKVDNESYVTNADGVLVASQNTSWELNNLTNQLFFDFRDLKPGDVGEDTISLHVNDNDAWICADMKVTKDDDVSCTEPELDDDPTCTDPNLPGSSDPMDGELGKNLNFVFWTDDGDNVPEVCRQNDVPPFGPIDPNCKDEVVIRQGTASDVLNTRWAIADASTQTGPLNGGDTYYIGKAWCFGSLTFNPVIQDGLGKTNPNTNGPLVRGTGVSCDGEQANNESQTDQLMVDVGFEAVQWRNNPDFLCDLED